MNAALLSYLSGQQFAVTLEMMQALQALFLAGEKSGPLLAAAKKPEAPAKNGGMVGVIQIRGFIDMRPSPWDEFFGGTNVEFITAALRSFLADPAIKSIMLDIDSPGGSVFGIEQLAAEVFDAREQKPVVAYLNPMAASAAYWIASGAKEIVMCPGGLAGSIGVYSVHEDISKMLEDAGIKVTIISAGKFKAEGDPSKPLTPEAQQAIQDRVDGYYDSFVRAVARGRGVKPAAVRSGYGQGRVLMGQAAIDAGLVDRIATADETIARLLGKTGSGVTEAAAAAEAKPAEAVLPPVATEPAVDESEARRRRARLLELA